MKRYFLIRVRVLILFVGITACSPVEQIQEEHSLGKTLGQSTTTVDANADAEAKTDAEELSPNEEIDLSLPEISPTVIISTQDTTLRLPVGDQDTALEQEKEPTLEQHVEPLPTMPIITETHQGFTYRPGQVVAVLAEGFEEGDTLAVTLVHEDQGQIDTHFVSPVSPRGNIPIYLPVEIEEAAIYPDGKYTFRVSGSDGTRKTYTFSLDFLNPADMNMAPFKGCGVYPEPVLDSIVFVWCTGHMPSAAPLDIRGVVDGEELFSDIVDTIYSDGVTLYVLDIFDDDPAGEWTLTIGQDELTFDVPGETHE
ncbi:MAG: hypothetical protein ISR58_12450 [Anaerolineales bacterium]|nr:hypothetical protein [Anaerolineales bacterium]